MYDNYHYPLGADNPNAPWNEPIMPDVDFVVDVECILTRKKVKVSTSDYKAEYDEETGLTDVDTEDTNWKYAYTESHYTIQELLNKLGEYIKQDIEKHKGNTKEQRRLYYMLQDCEDWKVYDETYSKTYE